MRQEEGPREGLMMTVKAQNGVTEDLVAAVLDLKGACIFLAVFMRSAGVSQGLRLRDFSVLPHLFTLTISVSVEDTGGPRSRGPTAGGAGCPLEMVLALWGWC